jgi:GT2 family glycosyltransferase
MKLALIIVSYNSYLDIENLLVSLRAQQRQGDLVIVVDNCSPNGDGERLMNRATDWGFSYISAPENN